MDWRKHQEHCREQLRSAIAPLTAPNPGEAARIEEAINNLVLANIAIAMQGVPRNYVPD